MSRETSNWLNNNVLVGMTDKRGNAWHYKASEQDGETNHYSGAVPIEDVRRRLFDWKAVEMPMFFQTPLGMMPIEGRKAIVRDDTYAVLGVPSARYAPHQYDEWLLSAVGNLLDDELIIGSAGLLRGGAVAWVQVEMPENMRAGDVEFRPNLLATTSFDGSIASTYKRTATIVVCDNTRSAALSETGQTWSVKHTAHSAMRVEEARQATNIIFDLGKTFQAEIEAMLAVKVTDQQFTRWVDLMEPLGGEESKARTTRAKNTRQVLQEMWTGDARVTPWKNTGFGVMQVANTFRQHLRPTRGNTMAVERTMMDTLQGGTQIADDHAARLLMAVAG